MDRGRLASSPVGGARSQHGPTQFMHFDVEHVIVSTDTAGELRRPVTKGPLMDVTHLPFDRLIDLELAIPDRGFLISLPAGPQYTNHLRTVHAVALLAVAEAEAGAFLGRQKNAPAQIVPVVRRVEAKFRRPTLGRVSARYSVPQAKVAGWLYELATRGRVSAEVPVEVDAAGMVVLLPNIEWFISCAAGEIPPPVTPDGIGGE